MARSLNLDQLTLRDKIREAARRAHDLNEHLEHSFVPKVHELRKLTRQPDPGTEAVPVADMTIRHHAAIVIDSENYTAKLDDDATALFESIVEEVNRILKN